jgi:tight adherence protein B
MERMNRHFLDYARPLVKGVGADTSRLPEFATYWRLGNVAFALWIAFGFKMIPVAVVTVVIGHLLGPVAVEWWVAKRRRTLNAQAATATRLLAGQIRASETLPKAFEMVARETPAPFGTILRRTTSELVTGKPHHEVFTDLKNTVHVEAITLLCTTMIVALKNGGTVSEVLTRIATSLEERQRIERKREADTAAGRMMIFLMAIFPILFLMAFSVMDSQMMDPMFTTVAGNIVLAVVGVLVYVSVRWSCRILAKVE